MGQEVSAAAVRLIREQQRQQRQQQQQSQQQKLAAQQNQTAAARRQSLSIVEQYPGEAPPAAIRTRQRIAWERQQARDRDRSSRGGGIVGGIPPEAKEHAGEHQKQEAAKASRVDTAEKVFYKPKEKPMAKDIGPSLKPPQSDLPHQAPPWAKPGEMTKRSKGILKAEAKDYSELRQLVPWLDFEKNWKSLEGKPVEKAAYLAGEIGATILILTAAGGVVRGVLARSPVRGGTFPKTPGIRNLTKAEVKQQLKDLAKKNRVTPKELKQTVPIEKPVKTPSDTVYIVQEGPAGKVYVRAAQPYIHPEAPGVKPPSGIKTATRTGVPLKGGGVKSAPPSTATMTLAQLLRQMNIDPVSLSAPKPLPLSTQYPGEAPFILPTPKKTPGTTPAKEPAEEPAAKPGPGKEISPAPSKEPAPLKEPAPSPAQSPSPKGSAAPAPAKAPSPKPSPAPAPAPKPAPVPAPVPAPPKLGIKTPIGTPIVPLVPPILPKGATDEQKRDYIRRYAGGKVTWNMGKLHNKDVWHVRFDNGKHVIVLGKTPQGATEIDGPGSATKTAVRVGKGAFPTIMQRHGAVTARLTPAATRKGVDINFNPTRSFKRPKRSIGAKVPGILTRGKPVRYRNGMYFRR